MTITDISLFLFQVCPSKDRCRTGGTDNSNADENFQSGIWALSVSNDFIENRMVNHNSECIAEQHDEVLGLAFTLVLTALTPLHSLLGFRRHLHPDQRLSPRKGVCRPEGVYHVRPRGQNQGERVSLQLKVWILHGESFSLSLFLSLNHSHLCWIQSQDNNFPRNVKRSVESNGLISREDFHAHVDSDPSTISSCDAFTANGEDNGKTAIVEDELDIGNDFSGQYALGDVQFLRWYSINNLHGIYW